MRHIEQKRVKPGEHTDTFREGPIYTVSINDSDIEISPKYSFSAAGGWLYTEWSEVCCLSVEIRWHFMIYVHQTIH